MSLMSLSGEEGTGGNGWHLPNAAAYAYLASHPRHPSPRNSSSSRYSALDGLLDSLST